MPWNKARNLPKNCSATRAGEEVLGAIVLRGKEVGGNGLPRLRCSG